MEDNPDTTIGVVANDESPVDEDVGDSAHDSDEVEAEDEEDECRVCRGPAEEGRPLFSPCKCSGSIGLTHQDCLTSWLEVTRGEGRCELCKVKFHFAPQYAEGAPELLGAAEIFLGIARRAVARWLPFLLRLCFCMSLWLLAAPLMTSYVYMVWMNRSISCVKERLLSWNTMSRDIVSGGYLVAIILLSFLSLMSFADFLRVEWQQQQQQRQDPLEPDVGRRFRRELVDAAEENRRRHHEVDNILLERLNRARETHRNVNNQNDTDSDNHADGDNAPGEYESREQPVQQVEQDMSLEGFGGGNPDNEGRGDGNENNNFRRDDHNENIVRNEDVVRNDEDGIENLPANRDNLPPRRPREDARPDDHQFDGDNMNIDEQVDLELQVALDELLGVRGPISVGIRNLLWLLLFNTFYLFFFAFIPKSVGSTVFSGLFNATNGTQNETISMRTAFITINERSIHENTIFRFPDFAAVNLGYLCGAFLLIMIRLIYVFISKCSGKSENSDNNNHTREHHRPLRREDENRVRARAAAVLDEAERMIDAMDDQRGPVRGHGQPPLGDLPEPVGISIWDALGLLLDATVSVVKVGVLLFLKMFLLPVLLGIWLDVASMELFGGNTEASLSWAGTDLLSAILLHWVAGITFMLLVTVSVLQLREVAHPGLLAHLIRPQEPQPDLLGNLMHDSVITQTKRMLLSLGIYSALLQLYVSLPVKLLTGSGISNYLGFIKLQFWNILMPQLQVPLELIVFHLCMLALLERHKNHLGELQHRWLVFISSRLGLTSFLLPQDIESFVFVGSIRVSIAGTDEINSVLYQLAKGTLEVGEHEDLIASSMERESPVEFAGETRDSGERVLKATQAYISLPAPHLDPRNDNKSDGSRPPGFKGGIVLLPTTIGRFRLKRREDASKEAAIEIWQEQAGKPLPRPPEGWDDLGAGGALEGRWAWAAETASGIERGVAQRASFFGPRGKSKAELATLLGKLLLLLIFSWGATTFFLIMSVSAPLGFGRLVFMLLRVPVKFIHDPWSFAVGSCISFPLVVSVGSWINKIESGKISRDLRQWARSFRLPPYRKAAVLGLAALLWLLIAPLALGFIYELCFVKSPSWFTGAEELFYLKDFTMSWVVGSVLLNAWACLCGLNFFTLEFWANMGNGMLEVEDENRRAFPDAAQPNDPERTDAPVWQGRDGRLVRFFMCARAAIGFDFDGVDHIVLLAECALPVSKTFCTLLVAPSLCYLWWFWSMEILFGYQDFSGSYRLYVFRLASMSTLFIQLCIALRKKIQRWFGAVHKAARDDRYLIGEILLNYAPDMES